MDQNTLKELHNGFQTAYINKDFPSSLAYKPQFVSNNYKMGKKVMASIEDELLACDHFQISVAFITMGGITPLLQTLSELEKRNIKGEILTTNYQDFSQPWALKKLHSFKNITLKMYDSHAANDNFHTKGYIFQNAEIYTLFLISTTDGEEGFEISRYVKAFENEKQLGCECYVMNCGCRNLIGIAGSHTKEAESLQNVFCRIMEEYPETKEEVTVYICEPCERLEEISRAYLAVLAESQKDSEEKVGQIVEVLKNPQQEFHYPELELNVLYEATVEQDTEKVVLIMEQLLESFPKQTEIDFICMALYCDIVRTYRRALNKTSLHSEELKMLLNIEKRPSPQSVQEIKAVIGAILRQSMECMKKQSISCVAEDEEINEIFRFIRENRESPGLCVKMVASQFDLSISNLSHRVKKATGRNVSDYITEMRMEYAHELLKDTDYNIQTIASMVGYTQASSFVSKFKKYYSVTPAEYRKKVKEDE